MKKLINLMVGVGFTVLMTSCPKKDADSVNPDIPNTGEISVKIDGISYLASLQYSSTNPGSAGSFITLSSANSSLLTYSDAKTFALGIQIKKAVLGPGDFPISPSDNSGSLTFTVNGKDYKQDYNDCSKQLFTNVTVGFSIANQQNHLVQGSINGKLAVADGEVSCGTLKTTKWKIVDVVGTFRLYYVVSP